MAANWRFAPSLVYDDLVDLRSRHEPTGRNVRDF